MTPSQPPAPAPGPAQGPSGTCPAQARAQAPLRPSAPPSAPAPAPALELAQNPGGPCPHCGAWLLPNQRTSHPYCCYSPPDGYADVGAISPADQRALAGLPLIEVSARRSGARKMFAPRWLAMIFDVVKAHHTHGSMAPERHRLYRAVLDRPSLLAVLQSAPTPLHAQLLLADAGLLTRSGLYL